MSTKSGLASQLIPQQLLLMGIVQFCRRDMLAVEAVIDIAYNSRVRPVCTRWLAERHGIPRRYLEHALQHLARQGILKSVRGPRGGYVLARERRRITVGDVLRSLGEIPGRKRRHAPHSLMGRVALASVWTDIAGTIETRLDRISMEHLCSSVQKAGIKPDGAPAQDFTI